MEVIFIENKHFYGPFNIFISIYLTFIFISLYLNTPLELIFGLKEIILSPDILITDYVKLVGIGPTLLNSALTSLSCLVMLMKINLKPNGTTIMSLWLVTGFSFFGKNIFNIWPIIFGVYLYSIY